ncbi:urea transporter [Elizabethkingia sp. JS20170427COW]|nr:urea transporter [Elizabethkingia sp. JS20170427COW]QCX54092.1 urea transporter [Elizabethkingia sp. JS20170427COW]
MLQENNLTGLLFIIGLFIGSVPCALAGLLAVVSSSIIAKILKFPECHLSQGLYDFSPALVGVALLAIFPSSMLVWLMVIVGGVLSGVLQHICLVKKLPVYTLPFIVITWLMYYGLNPLFGVQPFSVQHSENISVLSYIFRGFGEVIFQSNLWSGIIFF